MIVIDIHTSFLFCQGGDTDVVTRYHSAPVPKPDATIDDVTADTAQQPSGGGGAVRINYRNSRQLIWLQILPTVTVVCGCNVLFEYFLNIQPHGALM